MSLGPTISSFSWLGRVLRTTSTTSPLNKGRKKSGPIKMEETKKLVFSKQWMKYFHVHVLIFLQILFIILFSQFVIYNPHNAQRGKYPLGKIWHEEHSDEDSKKVTKPENDGLAVYPSKAFIFSTLEMGILKSRCFYFSSFYS